jgi:hypothetical protein
MISFSLEVNGDNVKQTSTSRPTQTTGAGALIRSMPRFIKHISGPYFYHDITPIECRKHLKPSPRWRSETSESPLPLGGEGSGERVRTPMDSVQFPLDGYAERTNNKNLLLEIVIVNQ